MLLLTTKFDKINSNMLSFIILRCSIRFRLKYTSTKQTGLHSSQPGREMDVRGSNSSSNKHAANSSCFMIIEIKRFKFQKNSRQLLSVLEPNNFEVGKDAWCFVRFTCCCNMWSNSRFQKWCVFQVSSIYRKEIHFYLINSFAWSFTLLLFS